MANRNYFLDYSKGILAFLVVLGHVITLKYTYGDYWNSYSIWCIYSFHMPLFIAISGYLTSSNIDCMTFIQFVRKKAERLLCCFLVKLSMKSSILRKYFLGYKS